MSFYTGGSNSANAASREAATASAEAAAAKRDVAYLEDQLERMKLVCAAVWELVKEKHALTEEDLVAKIALLDAKDGIADGKFSRAPKKCVKCGRTVTDKQRACMYCGAVQPFESVFQSL
ncbi:MAG TPA: hypothetical protein VM008_15785 [Phycisphaerae bacterium]|nr:hypothetical protein [Phycisphaerae bacterium]